LGSVWQWTEQRHGQILRSFSTLHSIQAICNHSFWTGYWWYFHPPTKAFKKHQRQFQDDRCFVQCYQCQ
jgi:hypothetical protein